MAARCTSIEGCDVVTLDEGGTVLRDSSLAVEGARIVGVGSSPPGFRPDERVDGEGLVALPAFFNGHCHAPMTFERGWAEDLPLDRWFNERIWVAESALTEDDVYWGARLAACEMVRSGIVGFNDHYFHMDRVAQVVEASGMKANLAWCVFGIGRDKEVGADLAGTLDFIGRWRGAAGGRIRCSLGPHSPYVCPPDFLAEVAGLARERGLPVHLHAAESRAQLEASLARHGRTPVGVLAHAGLLDVPVTVAHCLYLTEGDLALLARPEVTVARCPITYMKLAMGTNAASDLLRAGVRLALGTDGPGSNNDQDMFHQARAFSLLEKHVTGDGTAAAGDLPLRLAAVGAAHACGFPDSGVLAPGRPADLQLVDFRRPHLRPRHSLVANLVHGANAGDVCDVMCDGRWLLRGGRLLTIDEAETLAEAEARAMRMVGQDLRVVREYRA